MRILFVADGRSPIALNWIEYFLAGEHQVHLASTFDCQAEARLASFQVIPVAFSGLKKGTPAGQQPPLAMGSGAGVKRRTLVRQWLGPLTLLGAARRLKSLTGRIQPDLVHAMRIPFEGMLAATSEPGMPLLVSVWGNDFTLHARSTPGMGRLTRRALQQASALHSDCQRDHRLALEWGFDPGKTHVVLPGAGGVQSSLFYPPAEEIGDSDRLRTVINPRGIRAYVRSDSFFQAAALVTKERPGVRFLCPAMAGEAQAHKWLRELGIEAQVVLLPPQTRPHMAELFRRSAVAVSPSTHDGTPNTLLEAMACGCFPVAGDLEPLREWIKPGENGLLVDPADPQALSQAILAALEQPELRERARARNLQLVRAKADYETVMRQAEQFYRSLTGK